MPRVNRDHYAVDRYTGGTRAYQGPLMSPEINIGPTPFVNGATGLSVNIKFEFAPGMGPRAIPTLPLNAPSRSGSAYSSHRGRRGFGRSLRDAFRPSHLRPESRTVHAHYTGSMTPRSDPSMQLSGSETASGGRLDESEDQFEDESEDEPEDEYGDEPEDDFDLPHVEYRPTFQNESHEDIEQAAAAYGYDVHRNAAGSLHEEPQRSHPDRQPSLHGSELYRKSLSEVNAYVERLLSDAGLMNERFTERSPLFVHSTSAASALSEQRRRASVSYFEGVDQHEEGEIDEDMVDADGDLVAGAQSSHEVNALTSSAAGHAELDDQEMDDHLIEMGLLLSAMDVSPETSQQGPPQEIRPTHSNRMAGRPRAPIPATAQISVPAFTVAPNPGTALPTSPRASRVINYERYPNLNQWTLTQDKALYKGLRADKSWETIIDENPCLAKRTVAALKYRTHHMKHVQKRIQGNKKDGYMSLDARLRDH